MREVELAAALHLPLDELELGDLSLVWPLDQGSTMAARTAALSFRTPDAEDADSLLRASRSYGLGSAARLGGPHGPESIGKVAHRHDPQRSHLDCSATYVERPSRQGLSQTIVPSWTVLSYVRPLSAASNRWP